MGEEKDCSIRGKIFKFYERKGFGFINANNEQKPFFHISNVADSEKSPPKEGQEIVFDVVPSQKIKGGFDAINIIREWKAGVIVKVSNDKNFGFIRVGANKDSMHLT